MKFTIYCHTNTANGKRYVGQTRRGLVIRWQQHVCDATTGHQLMYFHRAIQKYGREAFTHEILEEVGTIEAANEAEQRWIAHYHSDDRRYGYNLDAGGGARLTAPTTKAKQSLSQKRRFAQPGAREKLSLQNIGRTAAPEARAKMSVARQGNHYAKGSKHAHSTEHRAKIAAARSGKSSSPKGWPVLQLDEQGTVLAEHPSMQAAARAVGTCGGNTIARCVAGRQQMAGGFRWQLAVVRNF